MDGPPRQEKKGNFWHAQGFRTHVVPMQILVPVVQGLAARCPPLKKLDGVKIVFLQGSIYYDPTQGRFIVSCLASVIEVMGTAQPKDRAAQRPATGEAAAEAVHHHDATHAKG